MVVSMSGKVGVDPPSEHQDIEPPGDAELLRGIADGERWAADALYERLYPGIARSLQCILHSAGADYDDLVQATFERIMRGLLGQRSGAVLHLSAWASGIATHVALDALRSRVRERKLFRRDAPIPLASLDMAGPPNGERQVDARRQLVAVQEVLASMKRDLAEAVLLHDLLGHDLNETAAMTNVSVVAAQSRLVRGRKEFLRRVELRLGKGGK